MTAILNKDIFSLIFSHIFNFELLRTTATTIRTSSQHPLRGVVLCRLLQLLLRLSSESLDYCNALINHFAHNVKHAGLVRDIAIVLGHSQKYIMC